MTHPSDTFRRRARLADAAMAVLFRLVGCLTVLLLVGIFLFLAWNGWDALMAIGPARLYLSGDWNPVSVRGAAWGMLGLVAGTVMISVMAMCIALPLGFALAVYLSDIASPRVRETLKPMIEMIAGIPSVVLGLLGLIYLAPLVARTFGLSNGLNALTASILVGIASVPSIASLSEDALSSVSLRMREASLALGATRWTTIRKVVTPAARSGVVAASMLGLGRAIGETIIVLMVAGNSLAFPTSLLSAARPMTATIAIEIREVVVGDLHWSALFAVGLTLFILTFVLNAAADWLLHRSRPT
jgi:phosphate transport system permease protein